MTNYEHYQEEMLIAAMTGDRCRFIMDHSGGECRERTSTTGPVCDICAERFREWLKKEYIQNPTQEIKEASETDEAMKRLWDEFYGRV